jgi:hypothetical protein
MGFLRIDESKCKKDSICAAEYPHHYPMMLGYPKFKYHRLPERKPPKIAWD